MIGFSRRFLPCWKASCFHRVLVLHILIHSQQTTAHLSSAVSDVHFLGTAGAAIVWSLKYWQFPFVPWLTTVAAGLRLSFTLLGSKLLARACTSPCLQPHRHHHITLLEVMAAHGYKKVTTYYLFLVSDGSTKVIFSGWPCNFGHSLMIFLLYNLLLLTSPTFRCIMGSPYPRTPVCFWTRWQVLLPFYCSLPANLL